MASIGTASDVIATITDQFGNLVDPGVVTAVLLLPDQTRVTPAVIRVSPGVYQFAYVWTQAGLHIAKFVGTTPYPVTNFGNVDVPLAPF